MAIPAYLWLKDDGGAAIKGSVQVLGREGSIEIQAFSHALHISMDGSTGRLMDKIRQKKNHLECVEFRCEKIMWKYNQGNIINADCWNEGL